MAQPPGAQGVGASWARGPAAPGVDPTADPAVASYLQFLQDDTGGLFSDLLDNQTLTAVCTADPLAQALPAPDEVTRKRIAEHSHGDSDGSDDDDAPAAGKGQGGGSAPGAKRSRSGGVDASGAGGTKDAARTKACREKARREKINER